MNVVTDIKIENMKWTVIVTAALFIVSIILQFIRTKKGKEYSEKLADLIIKQQYDEFYKMCEDSNIKKYVHPFNIDYMKLNAAMMQNSFEKVNESLDGFEKVRLNKKQKEAVYSNAFNYYVYKENKKGAQRCYDKLKEDNLTESNGIEMLYNTYVEEKYDFLDELMNMYEQAETTREKFQMEPYLIRMFENKKDSENAEKYKELLKQHIEELNR